MGGPRLQAICSRLPTLVYAPYLARLRLVDRRHIRGAAENREAQRLTLFTLALKSH